MFSSEQTFTINGDKYETLSKVIDFALKISGHSDVEGYYIDKQGLVWCSYGGSPYPFKATTPIMVEQAKQYIEGLTHEETERLAGEEPDNDGSVYLGWEVFYPLWYGDNGLENYSSGAFLAIRPCWIVYGK